MEINYWHTLLFAALIGLVTGWGIIKLILLASRRFDRATLRIVHQSITSVLYFFFPILFINIISINQYATKEESYLVYTLSKIGLIGVGTWLSIRVVVIFEKVLLNRLDLTKTNNNQERKQYTKIKFLKRIVVITILILAIALLLLSFQRGREFGLGLLTSAGIVSVIVGFAAQKSIANLLAGIQIAFTQPIKIEDVVIVEGEWGVIEEINLTYVIVKIWDLRRMVLPITYFIDKPFQNWTRNDSSIIGTAFFYLSYQTPVEKVRQYLYAELAENPLWDGVTAALQVTDTKDQYIVVRAIMSARNASQTFDLRCEIREKIIHFLQADYPESLPAFPIAASFHAPDSD